MPQCRVIQMKFIIYLFFFWVLFRLLKCDLRFLCTAHSILLEKWNGIWTLTKNHNTNQIRPQIERARARKLRWRDVFTFLYNVENCFFCLFFVRWILSKDAIIRVVHTDVTQFTYVVPVNEPLVTLSKPFFHGMKRLMMRKPKWWNFIVASQLSHFAFFSLNQWQCHRSNLPHVLHSDKAQQCTA